MKFSAKKLLNLSVVLAASVAVTACFENNDGVINKDNVLRLPALGEAVAINNGVVDKTAKITFGDAVLDSEWQYTDYRPAENIKLTAELNNSKNYSSGNAPKQGTIITTAPVIADGKIFTLGGQGEIFAREVKNPENIIWQSIAEKEFAQEKKQDKDFYESLRKSIYDKNQFNGGNLSYFDGKIYVTTKRGGIYVFNADNGEVAWQKQLNVPIRTTPVVAGNKVLITTFDDETLAFDANTGANSWKHEGIKEKSKYSTSPSPLVMGNKVILSYSSGEVFALDINSGNQIWSTILGGGFTLMGYKTAINDIKFSPILGGDKIFVVAGDGSLNAIDAPTGQRLWTAGSKIASTPWYANGYVFAVTLEAKIIAVKANDGTVVISKEVVTEKDDEDFNISGPVIVNGKILANDNKGNLFEISADTGAVERTISIPKNIEVAPIVSGNKVYFIDQKSNLIILE
jgi:outer membrane protein assembly factor BamB